MRRVIQPAEAPKRKYALCFGYLGTQYQGLQVNPGAFSVESMLEKALFLSGGVMEHNFGNLQKIAWTRTARTDKGVHAAAQCCAMKLKIDVSRLQDFIFATNSFLPKDIKLFDMRKVTKHFNAKNECTARKYEYLMPTYILTNNNEINREMEIALTMQGDLVDAGRAGGYAEPSSTKYLSEESLKSVRSKFVNYRIQEDTLYQLRTAVGRYVGTHKYHNFTTNKLPSDKSCQRYVASTYHIWKRYLKFGCQYVKVVYT